jgi:hypothetical protein
VVAGQRGKVSYAERLEARIIDGAGEDASRGWPRAARARRVPVPRPPSPLARPATPTSRLPLAWVPPQTSVPTKEPPRAHGRRRRRRWRRKQQQQRGRDGSVGSRGLSISRAACHGCQLNSNLATGPYTRGEPLPADQEQMQGLRGGGNLPAPAPKERMQGIRGGRHLPAPAPEEPMQGVRGAGICPHQRRRIECKECGGAGICPHQRGRSKCKECGGAMEAPGGAHEDACTRGEMEAQGGAGEDALARETAGGAGPQGAAPAEPAGADTGRKRRRTGGTDAAGEGDIG